MKKNHNLRKLKARKSYSNKDLAETLGIHIKTACSWKKEGLTPIYPEAHHPLFLGKTVKTFLKKKQDSKKVKLKPNQFYCLRCRRATTPKEIKIIDRGVTVGKQEKSIILSSECIVCDCPIRKITTAKNNDLIKNDSKKPEAEKVIKSAFPTPLYHSPSNKYK